MLTGVVHFMLSEESLQEGRQMTASSAKSSALDSLVEKLNTKASSLPKEQRDRAETALEEAADKARAAKVRASRGQSRERA
jgi:hypothetical protein